MFLSGKYLQSELGIEFGNPLRCVYILPSTDYFGVVDPIRKKKHMTLWLVTWYCFTKRAVSINFLIISYTKMWRLLILRR